MTQIILFNKPFNVLSQFQDEHGRATLKNYLANFPGFYTAGRLDFDSEGLLLLTNDGLLQHRISNPQHKLPKTYWVQVEGEITSAAITQLCAGVLLKDGLTQPAQAHIMSAPDIWPRNPPIRERKHIPTSWLSLTIHEGKNRQVRRMTASVGFPTLRLIRAYIGEWNIESLLPGEYRVITLENTDILTNNKQRQHKKYQEKISTRTTVSPKKMPTKKPAFHQTISSLTKKPK